MSSLEKQIATIQQTIATILNHKGMGWFFTHHPIVTKGKAIKPKERHHIEYGNNLCNMRAANATKKETGIAHCFSRDKGISNDFATNNASKNQITPRLNFPHCVIGPSTSAHNRDSDSLITGSQPSCFDTVINTAHATINNWVITIGGYRR